MHVLTDLGIQCGYEALSPTASTGITASLITRTTAPFIGQTAKAAIVMAETQVIRYRRDFHYLATAPTADAGMLLPVNTPLYLYGTDDIKGFRCIDTAAGASSVKVLLFF